MDSTTVYVKTDLGLEEIATRVRRVPSRVRAMLIMVDGRRSVGELLANNPAPDDARAHLESLLEGGFIAALEAAPAPEPVVPAPSAESPSAASAGGSDLPAVKQLIARMLIDFIGPDADLFTGRVEKANSKVDLVLEAEKLRQMLEGSVGRAKAEKFRAAVFPLLE